MVGRLSWDSFDVTGMQWFRRRWEESRGDEFDAWGPATYFFEVGTDGWPTRQVEDYDHGPTLRYGPGREEDDYGQLGSARLADGEDWTPWAITDGEFEGAWSQED